MIKYYLQLATIILLMNAFSSCANQSPLKQDAKTEQANLSQTKVSEKDSIPILKFTGAVRSILEDSKGNYWFGSWNEGVAKFDGQQITYFTKKDGLSDNQVRTIQEDLNGEIWLATGQGITRYDGKKMLHQTNFQHLAPMLTFEEQWNISPSDLWFNLAEVIAEQEGKGLARYDNHQLTYLVFPPEVKSEAICPENITITGIARGKENRIWFSSYCGVFGFDGTSFTTIPKGAYTFHVRAILEDRKGNLWIGNNGNGVLMYDGKTVTNFSKKHGVDSPEYFQKGQLLEDSSLLARVFSIGEDHQGNVWFGTYEAGLWKYDGKNLTHYTTKDGLTSMSIFEIYTDKKGKTWFGMGDGSVCRFNGISFEKVF